MSALNKFMKKRNGNWSISKMTAVAACLTSMIVAGQKTWPYVVQGVRPWAETPDKVDTVNAKVDMANAKVDMANAKVDMANAKVDVLTKKVDMIANRLGMDTDPKPPLNPYLPPRMQSEWAPTNRPTVAQVNESTNRTKL